MKKLLTLSFAVFALTMQAQVIDVKSIQSNCDTIVFKIQDNATTIEVRNADRLPFAAFLYEYTTNDREGSFYTHKFFENKRFRLDKKKFYKVGISFCDSICSSVFDVISDDLSEVIVDDDVNANGKENKACEAFISDFEIVTTFPSAIYPNPTNDIDLTLVNMTKSGLQYLKFYTVVGRDLTLEEIKKKEFQGVVICEYAKLVNNQILYFTERIIIH